MKIEEIGQIDLAIVSSMTKMLTLAGTAVQGLSRFFSGIHSRNRNFYHNLVTFVHFHSCNFLIANLVIYLTFCNDT